MIVSFAARRLPTAHGQWDKERAARHYTLSPLFEAQGNMGGHREE
jgi:hypothetical protein